MALHASIVKGIQPGLVWCMENKERLQMIA
jgi:hypothetical protein